MSNHISILCDSIFRDIRSLIVTSFKCFRTPIVSEISHWKFLLSVIDLIFLSNGFRYIWVLRWLTYAVYRDSIGKIVNLAPPYLSNHQEYWIDHRLPNYSEWNFGSNKHYDFFSAWSENPYFATMAGKSTELKRPFIETGELKTDCFGIFIGFWTRSNPQTFWNTLVYHSDNKIKTLIYMAAFILVVLMLKIMFVMTECRSGNFERFAGRRRRTNQTLCWRWSATERLHCQQRTQT